MNIKPIPHITPEHGFYCTYQFDPTLIGDERYISIRDIIRENSERWLEDLSSWFVSHCMVIEKSTTLWWLSSCSRLDARPWGSESFIKPLFFARGVVEWAERNPNVEHFSIVGMPAECLTYLGEFSIDSRVNLKVEGCMVGKHNGQNAITAMLNNSMEILYFGVKMVAWHWWRRGSNNLNVGALFLYEEVTGVANSREFFFPGMFSPLSSFTASGSMCLRLGVRNWSCNKKKGKSQSHDLYVLDGIRLASIFKAMFNALRLTWVIRCYTRTELPIRINGLRSKTFVASLLKNNLRTRESLIAILTAQELGRLVKTSKPNHVIYPYEEKCIERGILMALKGKPSKSFGYLHHPQHKLHLALREVPLSSCPRPTAYRVCGPAYIDMLTEVCGKSKKDIATWGSGKAHADKKQYFEKKENKILVLLSHPQEAKILAHWWDIEKRLSMEYFCLRIYGPMESSFRDVLDYEKRENVEILNGSLDESISVCDFALFCATSAGVEATLKGLLSIYVDINEFLQMDPFFGDAEPYYPCSTPHELASRLDWLRNQSSDRLAMLQAEQQRQAHTIFSPIDRNQIGREFI